MPPICPGELRAEQDAVAQPRRALVAPKTLRAELDGRVGNLQRRQTHPSVRPHASSPAQGRFIIASDSSTFIAGSRRVTPRHAGSVSR